MREIQLAGHTMLIYDDVEELPIERYQKFLRSNLVDSAISPTLGNIESKLEILMQYIVSDDKDNALVELQNLSMAMSGIRSGIWTQAESFAALVASIDGKPTKGTSEDMTRINNVIKKVSVKEMTDIILDLKKN